jgi:hypothetical protein
VPPILRFAYDSTRRSLYLLMSSAWIHNELHLLHPGDFYLLIFGNRFRLDSVPDLTAIEDLHLPAFILQHLGYSANHTFNT